MDRLWAPWRIEYILDSKPPNCIFCDTDDHSHDRERLILYRSSCTFVMLNRYPYTNGHLLIVPCRHTAGLDALSDEELLDLIATVRLGRCVLEQAASPQGYNIGINLGKAAGAGVDEHVHVHIVPRWSGDTNFMSVIADLRVMPENLLMSYDRLLPLFSACR